MISGWTEIGLCWDSGTIVGWWYTGIILEQEQREVEGWCQSANLTYHSRKSVPNVDKTWKSNISILRRLEKHQKNSHSFWHHRCFFTDWFSPSSVRPCWHCPPTLLKIACFDLPPPPATALSLLPLTVQFPAGVPGLAATNPSPLAFSWTHCGRSAPVVRHSAEWYSAGSQAPPGC